ncbi:hypothetical protein P7C70_g1352, partial [Phenoliferia sp. Uapishka_3]
MSDSLTSESLSGALKYGSVGLYGAAQRIFIAFALTSGPASSLIDAPFGRYLPASRRLTVNGNIGWLVMEIVSPLCFVLALASDVAPTSPFFRLPSLSDLSDTFSSLPIARRILASLFLVHYLNRAVISTFRNPGRARMHISVPLAAIFFNILNGSLQGFYIGGGAGANNGGNDLVGWGLRDTAWSTPLFLAGVTLWTGGFISNIICDEILYSCKRSRPTPPLTATPKERYSIPRGFLYDRPFGGASHPAYFVEWIEWTGYMLSTFALAPTLFPLEALANAGPGKAWITVFPPPPGAMLNQVPKALWPLQGWAFQPPALFL